jgi:hypothetical protein
MVHCVAVLERRAPYVFGILLAKEFVTKILSDPDRMSDSQVALVNFSEVLQNPACMPPGAAFVLVTQLT